MDNLFAFMVYMLVVIGLMLVSVVTTGVFMKLSEISDNLTSNNSPKWKLILVDGVALLYLLIMLTTIYWVVSF